VGRLVSAEEEARREVSEWGSRSEVSGKRSGGWRPGRKYHCLPTPFFVASAEEE